MVAGDGAYFRHHPRLTGADRAASDSVLRGSRGCGRGARARRRAGEGGDGAARLQHRRTRARRGPG